MDKGLLGRLLAFLKGFNGEQSKRNPDLYSNFMPLIDKLQLLPARSYVSSTEEVTCLEVLAVISRLFRTETLLRPAGRLKEEFMFELLAFLRVVDSPRLVDEDLKLLQLLATDPHYCDLMKKMRAAESVLLVLSKMPMERALENEAGEVLFLLRGEVTAAEKQALAKRLG